MTTLADLLARGIPQRALPNDRALGAFLDELQANILKPHGRRHAAHLFLSFAGLAPATAAHVLGDLGRKVTSARQEWSAASREGPARDGGTLIGLFLSAGGYRALGPDARLPGDPAFRAGLDNRGPLLADPPRAAWGPGWHDQPAPDAMLLMADADPDRLEAAIGAVQDGLGPTGARLLVIERGYQQRRRFPGRAESLAVEHFGFADVCGQQHFTGPEIAEAQAGPGGARSWNGGFSPGQVLIADPNGRSPFATGSYVVFRKLEQDVRGFKAATEALADALFGVHADDATRQRAAALVMGRLEDGTPLLPPGAGREATGNDFDVAGDPEGQACPWQAPIREAAPGAGLPMATARAVIMARRDITYGQRRMLPDESDFAEPEGEAPTRDVGLLFMACMRDITTQFERAQAEWAKQPGFVGGGAGIGPLIRQGGGEMERSCTCPGVTGQGFPPCVHMLGGAYFFAPSRGWLAALR